MGCGKREWGNLSSHWEKLMSLSGEGDAIGREGRREWGSEERGEGGKSEEQEGHPARPRVISVDP